MPCEFIITMTAADRIGVLAAVTNAMAELGGDLRETSQTVVRGYFTMIFAAEFPDDLDPQIIVDHLEGVCRPFGISLVIRNAAEEPRAVDDATVRSPYVLHMSGRNETGILRRIAGRLSIDAIDVRGTHANCADDTDSFALTMKLTIPPAADCETLVSELRALGGGAGFEVNLAPRD